MIQENKRGYRFYVIGTGKDYIKTMWSDALSLDNVIFIDGPVRRSFPLKKIYDCVEQKQYSYKINLRLFVPGKFVWRRYYTINDVEFNAAYRNVIVFSDAMRIQTDKKFWGKLKKKYNLFYCLILLNSCGHDFNAGPQSVKRIINSLQMDVIFSFDKKDALCYRLRHFPSLYSGIKISESNIEYDFYFVGKKKNRYRDIINTYFTLKKCGYKCLFRILEVEDSEMINDGGLIYNEDIPYHKVIGELLRSYGIVDIKIPEQEGLSLRYFEAVQYNKALLTNNQSVKELPYYRADYICCFNDIEEIPKMLKQIKKNVNYNYDGRYSPKKLLTMIQECAEEKYDGE